MKLGIIGLPNTGKTTLFNAMTQAGAESSSYPFSTKDSNVGAVPVPDNRLKRLEEIYNAKKVVPASVEFVDIAGLVRGSGKGEGLGNKFLAHIREVDAVVHVVRCFEDDNIPHVDLSISPVRDVETINLELIFADLEVIERRLTKASKAGKAAQKETDLLKRLVAHLESGVCARHMELEDDAEKKLIEEMTLLTYKPVLYAANVSENDLKDDGASCVHLSELRNFAKDDNSEVFSICAKIEAELTELDADEKAMFLAELGLEKSGLDRLIAAGFHLLGLTSFLTAGPKEVRAWTIPRGIKAPQAAGKIHSDIERGFIRVEIVNFEDLSRLGSYTAAKEHGLVRLEGKEYIMQENDVALFRFNV